LGNGVHMKLKNVALEITQPENITHLAEKGRLLSVPKISNIYNTEELLTATKNLSVTANTRIGISILTATNGDYNNTPKNVNKEFSLIENKLQKSSVAQVYNGTITNTELSPLELSHFLAGKENGIAKNQALILGQPVIKADENLPLNVGEHLLLTTSKFEAPKENRTKKIARTKENIKLRPKPSFILLDIDENEITIEAILLLLSIADKNLKNCIKILNLSSSSYIYDSKGNIINGLKGVHIYLAVLSGTDIPRYLKVLSKKLWLTGQGHIMIDKAGNKHIRSLIDVSVGSPERIIFEAQATMHDGLVQKKTAPTLIDGHLLDTTELHDLSDDEELQYQQLVNKAKQDRDEESKKVNQEYRIRIKKAVTTKNSQKKISDAEITAAIFNNILYGNWLLKFDMNKECVSVQEVLNDPEKYNNCTLADPIEHDYNGGRAIGQYYANTETGKPVIFSHAHGGHLFHLKPEPLHPLTIAITNKISHSVNRDITELNLINNERVADFISRTFYIPSKHKYIYVTDDNHLTFSSADMKQQIYRLYSGGIVHKSYYSFVEKSIQRIFNEATDAEKNKQKNKLLDLPTDELLGQVQLNNQRTVIKMGVDVFAKKSTVNIHKDYVEILYKFSLPSYVADAISNSDKLKIIADYQAHFPDLDEVLSLIVAARIVPDRKFAYLWMHCSSNWGKGFFISIFRELNLIVEVSQDELKKMFSGGPVGKSSHDFINAIILVIDEFTDIKKEVKQLESRVPVSPKHDLSFSAELYTKMFFSAENNNQLLTSSGVESQFANRFSRLKYTGDITNRDLFKHYGSGIYHKVCTEYVAKYLAENFTKYIEMGKSTAIKECEGVVNNFHQKNSLLISNHQLTEGIETIASEILIHINNYINQSLKHPIKINNIGFEATLIKNVFLCDKKQIIIQRPIKLIEDYIKEYCDSDSLKVLGYKKNDICACIGELKVNKITVDGKKTTQRCIIL